MAAISNVVKLVRKLPKANGPETPGENGQALVSVQARDGSQDFDLPPMPLDRVSISRLAHHSECIDET